MNAKLFLNRALQRLETPPFKTFWNLVISIMLLVLTILLGVLFKAFNIHESNIILLFIINVMAVNYLINGFWISVFSSALSVLAFNYFFTEPYYSLRFYRSDYAFTFFFMLISGLFVSTLTSKLVSESQKSKARELRISVLFSLSQKLLYQPTPELLESIGVHIAKQLNMTVCVAHGAPIEENIAFYSSHPSARQISSPPSHHISALRSTFENRTPHIEDREFYDDYCMLYIPVCGATVVHGVIGFMFKSKDRITAEHYELGLSIGSLVALGLDNALLEQNRINDTLLIKGEAFKNNILRALSHDLRTPLTGIIGTSASLLEGQGHIGIEERDTLLKGIHDSSQWLLHTVENALRLSQLKQDDIKINFNQELLEDFLLDMRLQLSRIFISHSISLKLPAELLFIRIDANMLRHAIINLVDNAFRHNPGHVEVSIFAEVINEQVQITIQDNGIGIPDYLIGDVHNQLKHYQSLHQLKVSQSSLGLGLESCVAIVEAHEGRLVCDNRPTGGASFTIILPRGD